MLMDSNVSKKFETFFGKYRQQKYRKGEILIRAGGGALYGIGVIGALIYYLQHATSILDGIVGIIYAIFWPGVILYKVLELLKM